MNIFAKFDEIPSMIIQDIRETKRYGHTFVRSFVCSDGRTDNVKFLLVVFVLKIGMCLQGLIKFPQ